MFSRKSKSKAIWQNKYLKEVFSIGKKFNQNYTRTILNNSSILDKKDEYYFPNLLYKFYAPTSDNILDIKNKRLWMAHPSSFNDPFDCCIGFDEEAYEKYCLLKIISSQEMTSRKEESEKFTNDEITRLEQSRTDYNYGVFSRSEDYLTVKYKVFEQKSDKFKTYINQLLTRYKSEADDKIKCIQNHKIRVSCFSDLSRDDEVLKKIQMWSHYADNHKGFCVEYDISPLKGRKIIRLEDYEYYSNEEAYLKERIIASIKGGIFPIVYGSQRVNLPITRLDRIQIQDFSKSKYYHSVDELNYKAFIFKSSNWSYEKEWRIILEDRICKCYDNKIPFPYIKKIYLGCKMDQNLIKTMLELGDELGIEVSIMTTGSKKFILEEKSSKSYHWEKAWSKLENPFIY